MSGARLYRSYARQLAAFRESFDKIRKQPGMEDIHQLRVAIKKMRANLTLMQHASRGAFRKRGHFSLLSSLFKRAGELREIQLNQALVTTLELEDLYPDDLSQRAIYAYLESLEKRSRQSVCQLNRRLRSFNFRRLKKRNKRAHAIVVALADDVVIDESNAFVAKQIGKIGSLRPLVESDQALHKIRTSLKSMVESYRLIIEIYADEAVARRVERLKVIEGLIGEWHDLKVLISSMQHFAERDADTGFSAPLQKIVAGISERAGKIKGETVTHLDDLFQTG